MEDGAGMGEEYSAFGVQLAEFGSVRDGDQGGWLKVKSEIVRLAGESSRELIALRGARVS